MRVCLRDLAIGLRIALAGGRRSAGRLALTAVSTGLGIAVLLLAAAVPEMWHAHEARFNAVAYRTSGSPLTVPTQKQARASLPPGVDPLYVAQNGTSYRGLYIDGLYLNSGGPHAPVPPGVDRVPAPGEVYLSPHLAKLLRSPEGALLRPRFPQRVVGTIGEAGLTSPRDYRFYAGTDKRYGFGATAAMSVLTGFGDSPFPPAPLPAVLWLLLVVGVVVLLIPVLTVVATAGRVGGLARDRRLAALRLVGAGVHQTRRIAAGEALAGSLAGVAVGVGLFLVGRILAQSIEVWGLSFFTVDIHPAWSVAVLVLLLGPVLAVQAAMFALRGAIIEPLGVVRQATAARRRLWWRLVPAVLGALLLGILLLAAGSAVGDTTKVVAAIGLLLVSVPAVLPWLVERLVRALPHGPVSYELAVRRLRLDPGPPARLVGGVAVILAGAIALQTVVLASEREVGHSGAGHQIGSTQPASSVVFDGGALPAASGLVTRLTALPGVSPLGTVRQAMVVADGSAPIDQIGIADCTAIERLSTGASCADGDVFINGSYGVEGDVHGGQVFMFASGKAGQPGQRWQLPRLPKQLTSSEAYSAVLVTPGALRGIQPLIGALEVYLRLDQADPDAIERVANAVAPLSWQANVRIGSYNGQLDVAEQVQQYRTIRRGLLAGALVTLVLAGASMVGLAAGADRGAAPAHGRAHREWGAALGAEPVGALAKPAADGGRGAGRAGHRGDARPYAAPPGQHPTGGPIRGRLGRLGRHGRGGCRAGAADHRDHPAGAASRDPADGAALGVTGGSCGPPAGTFRAPGDPRGGAATR